MGPTSTIKFKLLGGCSVVLPSGLPVELAGKKNRALLAYLAMGRGKQHSREKLIALLWSDRSEAQARGSLRQALSALKETLAGVAPAVLVLQGDDVALDPDAVATDVAEFEALAGLGSPEDLRVAAGLYEGDLLEGLTIRDPAFEDWLAAERSRLREVATGVLGQLAATRAGPEAVAMAKRLVALDPLREASHRALMQAYAGVGEKALALQHYAQCCELLKADLGVAPARETEELRQSILAGDLETAGSLAPSTPRDPTPKNDSVSKAISVAVMPFANLSGDTGQDYFADGITEDLITALAKCRQLSVATSSSTFGYKNQALNAQEFGRELGVSYVVEGSVRRDRNRVRITAKLVDATSGAQLWAERFDRELADVFAVQDEVLRAVLAQLVYSLVDAAAASRRSAPTASLTAYDHLLRARAAWRRGAVIETRDHLLNAVDADPNYAAGLAFLAFFYGEDRAMQMSGISHEKAKKLAEEYAERAITNDDGDPFVYHMLGTAFLSIGKLDTAKHHFELALSLNPHYPNTTINFGCTIAFSGQHQEGLDMIERAFWLEPRLAPAMRAVPMYVHYLMRRYDEAIADFARIDSAPAFMHLIHAMSLALAGRTVEAKEAVEVFEIRRPSGFEIAGFAQCFTDMMKLPEDKELWLEGLRKLGFQVGR